MDAFKVLEPIDIQQPLDVRALPSLGDAFYIPNLEDQPQNPIILNLNKKLDNTSQLSHRIFIQHRVNQNSPKELTLLLGSALDSGTTQQTDDNIWLRAAKRPLESSVSVTTPGKTRLGVHVCFLCATRIILYHGILYDLPTNILIHHLRSSQNKTRTSLTRLDTSEPCF